MYKHVLSPRQCALDIIARAYQMAPQIRTRQIQDVHLIDLQLQALGCGVGKPGYIEDLDEMADVEVAEEAGVKGGGEGAEVEGAAGRTAGNDLVHGCAHGLHDLWGHLVEPNHVGRGRGRGRGGMVW
jgi:hypothetical protein